jgi:hypothetical protein
MVKGVNDPEVYAALAAMPARDTSGRRRVQVGC